MFVTDRKGPKETFGMTNMCFLSRLQCYFHRCINLSKPVELYDDVFLEYHLFPKVGLKFVFSILFTT